MQNEAEHAEFLALLKAAREQIAFLKELGVEGTEKQSTHTTVQKRVTSDEHREPYAPAPHHPMPPQQQHRTHYLET